MAPRDVANNIRQALDKGFPSPGEVAFDSVAVAAVGPAKCYSFPPLFPDFLQLGGESVGLSA